MSDFSLLETIIFIPNEGFYLLEGHLQRLQDSIQDFKRIDSSLFPIKFKNQDVVDILNDKVPNDGNFQRVRLLVNTASEISVECVCLPTPKFSFDLLKEAAINEPQFSVVLDIEPSATVNDPYVLHKTTKRQIYETARQRNLCDYHATQNEPFDVILYNENNEITETSIANIAIRFDINGSSIWKTPKISSGLLPGVFRSFLLDNETNLIEDTITVNDLLEAKAVW